MITPASLFNLYNEFILNPTISTLKKILIKFKDEKININSKIPYINNITLLHIIQPYETMRYLLDRGGDPNVESEFYKLKPIHFQYDYRTIKLLVSMGALPNPKDINNFNPLFWQKDSESIEYLLKYNTIYNCNILNISTFDTINQPYITMLINGGYDPYSENNISITPIFLQKNIKSLEILIKCCYYNHIKNYDIVGETLLFKPCINNDVIKLLKKYDINDSTINHQNIIGNTALHVQYIYENIKWLLFAGISTKIKNLEGLTAYEYHMKRKNFDIAKLIKSFVSAKIIQIKWRYYWFIKNYIPPRYFKIKLLFMEDFKLLPPSECNIFPGGIDYQMALDDYNQRI